MVFTTPIPAHENNTEINVSVIDDRDRHSEGSEDGLTEGNSIHTQFWWENGYIQVEKNEKKKIKNYHQGHSYHSSSLEKKR